MTDPQPGDFALVHVSGTGGRLIRVGQWLCGDGFADFEHAVVAEDRFGTVGAYPGGARRTLGLPVGAVWSSVPLTDEQRTAVVKAALGYVGTPYSFLDYVAIGLHRLRVPVPFLRRYIATTRHMVCSQLVDQCYRDAGVQLFPDGRWPGYVTPGDLYELVRGKVVPS